MSLLNAMLGGELEIIMIIKAIAATTETQSNGIHFTCKALYQLAETAKSKPVTNSFDFEDVVGIVLSASVIDESLIIEVDIYDSFISKIKDTGSSFYLCPAFLIKSEIFTTSSCFVDDLECVGFGIVDNPQDRTLTKIDT